MPNKPHLEYLEITDAEVRAEQDEDPKLVGYASKYGNWYRVGDFMERVEAGAFDDVLADKETDVVSSPNHDLTKTFAKQSAGTLRVKSNSVGLRYEIDIDMRDDDARNTFVKVRNKTITGSSFMFSLEPGTDDSWVFPAADMPRRTIHRIRRLFELGPVLFPANTAATVKARADEILAEARSRYAGGPVPPQPPESPTAPAEEPADEHRDENEEPAATVSAERQRQSEYAYQEMGRLLRYVESKNRSPES